MENQKKMNKLTNLPAVLWISSGLLTLGLLFARAVFPEMMWLTIGVGLLLLVTLGTLIVQNQRALKSRSMAFGLNSGITALLVVSILGVLNFLSARYPYKLDLTKNKIHTLSDQTVKLTKGLKQTVKATLYAKMQQKEQFRPLLDNYQGLSPKFEVEYVDPDREPTRAKQAGIKKYGTLVLSVGSVGDSKSLGASLRESKLEDPTEEKLTNALIKLLKEKTPTLCATTGHGEKSFGSQEAEGYASVKKALGDQSYEVKDLNLLEETKVPESCDALAILGPTKSFFDAEVTAISTYLNEGGRAVIATDLNLTGEEYSPGLLAILKPWHVKPAQALIVDPLSKMLGVDASVAILATFSKENPITKEFQGNCAFPFSRPLEIVAGIPEGITAQWIAQTTPKSWGVTQLSSLSTGQVSFTPGKDLEGPLNSAVVVEGKQKGSQAKQSTRLVVFGTSAFATNNFARYAGNLDFFLNSVSWIMEDESLISIRAKEDEAGKVELSSKAGTSIFLLTVVVIPLIIAASGVGIWVARRKL